MKQEIDPKNTSRAQAFELWIAAQVIAYVQKHHDGHLDCAYVCCR